MSDQPGILRRLFKGPRKYIIALLLIAGGGYAYYDRQTKQVVGPVYKFTRVARGAVDMTVSASGTLKALVTVEVGAQVSGQISKLFVDFNSRVKAGQTIARIDPRPFEAKVKEARADLAVSKATVAMHQARLQSMIADIAAASATLRRTKRTFERKEKLVARRFVSQADLDTARAEYEQARARHQSAKAKEAEQRAQLKVVRAQVELRRARLQQRELDLDHTIIRSPVDGIVISRDVDLGQTVAASLQAPVLFKIAQDLRKMQVEVRVDEADIGQIKKGQVANFGVDSFPNRKFPGAVLQIRKDPKEESNVVTYTVIVSTINAAERLLPGMTANVTFYISRRKNVLKVANAALRYRPGGAKTAAASSATRGRPTREQIAKFRERARKRFQAMVKDLRLTNEQVEAIRELRGETRQRMRALFMSGKPRSQMRDAFRKLRRAGVKRMLKLLTPRQRKIYQAKYARTGRKRTRPAALYIAGPDGKPKRVRVLIGISDGTATEIVRGPLKVGARVITGVRRTAKSKRRLRFGF